MAPSTAVSVSAPVFSRATASPPFRYAKSR